MKDTSAQPATINGEVPEQVETSTEKGKKRDKPDEPAPEVDEESPSKKQAKEESNTQNNKKEVQPVEDDEAAENDEVAEDDEPANDQEKDSVDDQKETAVNKTLEPETASQKEVLEEAQ